MIQQLPGLWDQIKPEAMQFMGAAMQRMNPDHFAQKRLQEMIQQNPQVLEQIANMDDTQRAAFAQQMGFRKQDPISGIAPGAQRQEREANAKYMATATPEQQDIYNAKKAGTVSRFELGRTAKEDARTEKKDQQSDTLFDMTVSLKGLEQEEKGILLNEQKRQLAKLEAARAKYPQVDFNRIMKESFTGQMSSEAQEMMTVIGGDSTLKETLSTLYDLEKFSRNRRDQFSLRAMGVQDDTNKLFISLSETARKEVTDAGNAISKINKDRGFLSLDTYLGQMDPSGEMRKQYDELVTRYNEGRSRYQSIAPIVNKKFGIPMATIPELDATAAPTGIPALQGAKKTETPAEAIARLRKRP